MNLRIAKKICKVINSKDEDKYTEFQKLRALARLDKCKGDERFINALLMSMTKEERTDKALREKRSGDAFKILMEPEIVERKIENRQS